MSDALSYLGQKGKIESEAADLAAELERRVPLMLPLGHSNAARARACQGSREASGEGARPGGLSHLVGAPPSEASQGVPPGFEARPEGWSITPRNRPPGQQTVSATSTSEPVLGEGAALEDLDGAFGPPPPSIDQDGRFPGFYGPVSKGLQQLARVVLVRVDWLILAFKVEPLPGVLDPLLARIVAGVGDGPVDVSLGGAEFKGKRTAAAAKYVLENATLNVTIELNASGGWNVAVEFSGTRMANRSTESAVELARRMAGALGSIHGMRCRRLDLAVDVAGWELGDGTHTDRWVKPRQAGWGNFNADAHLKPVEGPLRENETREYALPQIDVYTRNERVTGLVLCPKGNIRMIGYDKRAELAIRQPWKRADEEARWLSQGWDGESAIARFEFKLNGEALNEMSDREGRSLRDGDRALRHIDAIWTYLTCQWIRLVDVDTATRKTRAQTDPRWLLLQGVRFAHAAQPIARVRRRGGASAGQAFGAATGLLHASLLASGERFEFELPVLDHEDSPTIDIRMVDNPGEYADRLTPERAYYVARQLIDEQMALSGECILAESIELYGGARPALAMMLRKTRATMARHSTISEAA